MARQRTYEEIKRIFPDVTEDEWKATQITAQKFGKIYTKEAGKFYCQTLERLKAERENSLHLSCEGIDVGNIVKSLLNPDPVSMCATEIPGESLYTIGSVAVNFQRQGDTVIMRLVEKQIPEFTHQNYGICKHGGPGAGFPCEECR